MGNLHNKTQIPITDAKYSTEKKNWRENNNETGSIYAITSERTSVRPTDHLGLFAVEVMFGGYYYYC